MSEPLATGWEPDAPAADSLIRAYVLATAARGAALAEATGAQVHRTEVAAFAGGVSGVLLDNAVILLAPTTAAGARAVVEEALDFFPPDCPFIVLSAWPVPEAGDLGIGLMGHPPFMLRPAGPPPASRDTSLDVRRVTDAAGLEDFSRTVAEAFPLPGERSTLADPAVLGLAALRLWVGYEGDRPVGTAAVWVDHGLNDVEWISVHQGDRGKGYGQALTWAATVAVPDLPAVLIASDDGQPVYERMGYLRLTRMTLWYREP